MNCQGLWQLAASYRHHYNLLTRQGPKFFSESLRLKYGISKRSYIREADSKCISSDTIKQVLVNSDMNIKYGHTSIITQCPRVSLAAQSSSLNRLYINTTSGHFVCEHCNKRGAWPDLKDNLKLLKSQEKNLVFSCFKDVESVQPFLQDVPSARELLSSCVPFGSLQDEDADRLKATFGLELLKTETLDRFGVRCDLQHNYVLFPVIANGHVLSVKKITCHSHSDEVIGTLTEEFIPRSSVTGVFGLDMVAPSVTDVVLTSSEVDAMAVVQETKTAAISLPSGYSSLPQEVFPSLERFEKIIFWFGDNFEAWQSADVFARKLNSTRCHIIRPSVDDPRPMTALKLELKLSTILSKAEPIPNDFVVIYFPFPEEVFSHSERVAGVEWKRFPILNKLLKGHRRGEMTIFTGPARSGKTTFMSEYSLDLCMQGVSTLWGNFENNNERLSKVMLTQFAQQNLAKNTELFDVYKEQFQSLPMYFMSFRGEKSIKKVFDALSHAVYVHDIAHLVLDNLQFKMDWYGSGKQENIVRACRKLASSMNCHLTLVIHPTMDEDIEHLASLLAHNVLVLQGKSVPGKKYLKISKNRFGGNLERTLLTFDKESRSFAAKE